MLAEALLAMKELTIRTSFHFCRTKHFPYIVFSFRNQSPTVVSNPQISPPKPQQLMPGE
jgi:hypothetical protein